MCGCSRSSVRRLMNCGSRTARRKAPRWQWTPAKIQVSAPRMCDVLLLTCVILTGCGGATGADDIGFLNGKVTYTLRSTTLPSTHHVSHTGLFLSEFNGAERGKQRVEPAVAVRSGHRRWSSIQTVACRYGFA